MKIEPHCPRIASSRNRFANACPLIQLAFLVVVIAGLVTVPVFADDSARTLVEVRGVVVDSQGLAIRRAELRSNPSLETPPLATTDEMGKFSFRVPKQTKLHLLTLGPGSSPALQKIEADDNLELKIQLQPSLGLRLKLVDAKGIPVPGVRVSGDDWRDFAIIHHMTSNEEGRVSWSEAPNDSMEFLITKEGFSPKYNLKLKAQPEEQTVVLSRIVELLIQAHDLHTNESIPEFTAVPVLKPRADAERLCYRHNAVNTRNGEVTMKLHDSDSQTCQIRIETKGYAAAYCPEFEIVDAPAKVVVKLQRSDALRGRIVDTDGKPIPGAKVSLANATQPFTLRQPDHNYTIDTNEAGEFSFSKEVGDYTILAQHELGFALKHCHDRNSPGTIQLQPWATINGKISQGDSAISDHLVSLFDLDLEEQGLPRIDLQQFARSDQQGFFAIERVPRGNYALQAVHSIFKSDKLKSTESMPLALEAGEHGNCDLGTNGSIVRGKIQAAKHAERKSFAYRWSLNYLVSLNESVPPTIPNFNSPAIWSTSEGAAHLKSYRHWQFKLDDDGSYEIHGVPSGKYRMYVNLFDTPQDGCLTAPIAIQAIDVLVPQLQETVALPTVEMEVSDLLAVGDVVPDFEYIRLDGTSARLHDLRGKMVLIQLWATWCGPCIAEFPEVHQFAQSATGKRCVILGLNVDGPERKIDSLLDKFNADWPQGRLPSGLDSSVLRQLSVSSIPMHFVIDHDGKLLFAGRDFKEATAVIPTSYFLESKP
jgi:thiol-disulfide isomerase/thioredoxin